MTATSCWVTETRNKDKMSLGTDHLISKFSHVSLYYIRKGSNIQIYTRPTSPYKAGKRPEAILADFESLW